MFVRTRRVGGYQYTELVESYRHPETGKPTHRTLVRWRGLHEVAAELQATVAHVAYLERQVAGWRALQDGTRPDNPVYRKRHLARKRLAELQVRLDKQTHRLTELR